MPSQQKGGAGCEGAQSRQHDSPEGLGSAGSGGERCLGRKTPSVGFGQPAAGLSYFSKSD